MRYSAREMTRGSAAGAWSRLLSFARAWAVLSLFFILVPGVSFAAPSREGVSGKVALLRFENFTEFRDAAILVTEAVRENLIRLGVDLVDEETLNRFLLKERIRNTGYISKDVAQKIRAGVGASVLCLGAVYTFFPSETPELGISARMVDTGDSRVIWADSYSATGTDFASLLGIGMISRMEDLIPRIVERAFRSYPPETPLGDSYRVAIMPFRSDVQRQVGAGMIAAYLFITELFKGRKFLPIEFGEVKESIVGLRVRNRGDLDFRNMKGLAESLAVDGFLVGTVEVYSDGRDTNSPPEASITARLIDARTNRILWYDGMQMNGDEKIIVLDFGKIRTVDRVAQNIISRMARRLEKIASD